ncbi:MAG: hypothetical protein DMF63_12525 [Acidobacteria bacterium]|nr:MAG: hypothetical protein DMF63_12525 [Acidobacteriota bacterium]
MKNQIILTAVAILFVGVISVSAQHDDTPKGVEGAGVFIKGWTGSVDAKDQAAGLSVNSAKLVTEGKGMHVTTGPATTYWNPANTAKGDYTVSATFTESKYMSINDHPHPYGIMIGGNDLGTDKASYLYCAAYGNGTFIVRGFGPAPFQMGKREPNDAINKAAGVGQPVTQTIAMSVKGNQVTCSINNKVVGTYERSALVMDGKLKSTDGVYGFRFAHNTDAIVSDFKMTK